MPKKKPKLDFDKWFVAQFGKRPYADRTLEDLVTAEMNAYNTYIELQNMYKARLKYEDIYNATLKAYTATEYVSEEFIKKR